MPFLNSQLFVTGPKSSPSFQWDNETQLNELKNKILFERIRYAILESMMLHTPGALLPQVYKLTVMIQQVTKTKDTHHIMESRHIS